MVNGTAAVSAPNDTAGFTTGVDVRRSTAGDALRSASAVMRRVIAAIEARGVAAKDIRTQHVGVHRSVLRRHHRSIVTYVATTASRWSCA